MEKKYWNAELCQNYDESLDYDMSAYPGKKNNKERLDGVFWTEI
jgi:hypothetical protein